MRLWVKLLIGAAGTIAAAVGADSWAAKHLFDEDGYNRYGYDRDGYDREGFDENGWDRDGYNRRGFNEEGYDREGFDEIGLNFRGYGRDGYNPSGYNIAGFDRNGWDRRGFDRSGFNRDGYDRYGYDRLGYSVEGLDRSKQNRLHYIEKAGEVAAKQKEAHIQMKLDEFDVALLKIRQGLEICVVSILNHRIGPGHENNRLDYNLSICEQEKILDADLIEKLRSAKKHSNDEIHPYGEKKEYRQVHFCYKMLEEALEKMQEMVGISN